MTYSRSLVTFAFVRDALQSGDIVAGLFPLFAPAIKRRHGKTFNPAVFAKDLEELCGLAVHPYIIEDWAPRMAQHGLLIEQDKELVGTRSVTTYICADPNIPDIVDLESRIVRLFEGFEAYAKVLLKSHGLGAPARAVLERELVTRIQSMGFDNILAKPDRSNGANVLTLERRPAEQSPDQHEAQIMDVICATFIIELHRRQPEQFALVTELAAGALAAEVVLSFRVPPKTGSSFKGMKVFLDSPLILDLLDVGGQEERDFARYLVDALRKEGAIVATYEHNVGEIVDVLTAAVQNLERKQPVSGQIGSRMRTDNNTVIRAKAILSNPQKRVRDNGIDIADAKALDRTYMNTFDANAEMDLLGKIRPFQGAINARAVDAASIASVIRYLYGRRPKGGIMAHERIFVTKNTGLVRAALSYIHRLPGLEIADVPILSDRAMAGTVWVAMGGKGTELPLHKLLANCTAALRPRRDVIEKVMETLKSASPEDQMLFKALIEDERCGYCLMQSTLGDAALVTDESTPHLLRLMKRATAAEVIEEKDKEIKSVTEEFEVKLAEVAAARKADAEEAKARLEQAAAARKADAEEAGRRLGQTSDELEKITAEAQAARERNTELNRQLKEAEMARRTDREARVQTLFHRSRYYEWAAYAAVFIPIAMVLYLLSEITGKLEGWSWLGGLGASFVLGLVQFAVFPNVLFGRFARNVRLRSFRRWLMRNNLSEYDAVKVSWDTGTVVFEPAVPAIEAPPSALSLPRQ